MAFPIVVVDAARRCDLGVDGSGRLGIGTLQAKMVERLGPPGVACNQRGPPNA